MLKNRGVLLLALSQTVGWAGLYYLFPALLLRWEMGFGWSKPELTIAITSAIFMSAVVSPLAGRLIDIGKGAHLMFTSAILGGIGLFLVSNVTELWQFYLAWGFIGIMISGCLYEPCFSLITRAKGESAKNSIVLVTLIAGFASSISFPVVYLLSEMFGWRVAAQVFAGAVIFVGAPLAWFGASFVENENSVARIEQPRQIVQRRFLRSPVFWCLAISFSFAGILHGITLHHLLPILSDRNIDPNTAIAVASLIGPMQVLGRLMIIKSERLV